MSTTTAARATTTPTTSERPTGTVPGADDPTDTALRDELLSMLELDQAVRGGPVPSGVDPDTLLFDEVDRENQARLAEIFDEHGWPGWALVGEAASTAAWAIVQHADLDPGFQERGLTLLDSAVDRKDASPGDLAYLTDRVLVGHDQPQIYATQWQLDDDGEWMPRTPIVDEEHIDATRASVGLGTLADYLDELDGFLED